METARRLDEERDDLDLTIVLVGRQTPPEGVLSYREVIGLEEMFGGG